MEERDDFGDRGDRGDRGERGEAPGDLDRCLCVSRLLLGWRLSVKFAEDLGASFLESVRVREVLR